MCCAVTVCMWISIRVANGYQVCSVLYTLVSIFCGGEFVFVQMFSYIHQNSSILMIDFITSRPIFIIHQSVVSFFLLWTEQPPKKKSVSPFLLFVCKNKPNPNPSHKTWIKTSADNSNTVECSQRELRNNNNKRWLPFFTLRIIIQLAIAQNIYIY